MTIASLVDFDWFHNLDQTQQELVRITLTLLEREQEKPSDFNDYSFLVFPLAKAYEGVLKQFFYDLGIISKEAYQNRYFRIGKALNPDLNKQYRDSDWVVEDLDRVCQSGQDEPLSQILWQQWQRCRNSLFHYLPDETNCISLTQAENLIKSLFHTLALLTRCQRDQPSV